MNERKNICDKNEQYFRNRIHHINIEKTNSEWFVFDKSSALKCEKKVIMTDDQVAEEYPFEMMKRIKELLFELKSDADLFDHVLTYAIDNWWDQALNSFAEILINFLFVEPESWFQYETLANSFEDIIRIDGKCQSKLIIILDIHHFLLICL